MEEEEGGALARFVDVDADDVGLPAFFLLTSVVDEELDEEVDELVRLLEAVSLLRPIVATESLEQLEFVSIDLFVFVFICLFSFIRFLQFTF